MLRNFAIEANGNPDTVSAEFFPPPRAAVADYLQACEEAKIITYHSL
jgi:hypothetical protein